MFGCMFIGFWLGKRWVLTYFFSKLLMDANAYKLPIIYPLSGLYLKHFWAFPYMGLMKMRCLQYQFICKEAMLRFAVQLFYFPGKNLNGEKEGYTINQKTLA